MAERGDLNFMPEEATARSDGHTITVPARLNRAHPAVAALRDDKRRFDITGAARSRALRILEGLVRAVEELGYTAREVRSTRSDYGYVRWNSKDHLIIDTGATAVGVRVRQETDKSPHVPTQQELERAQRWGTHPPKYDHTRNERLRIEIDSHWDGRQHLWRDGKRAVLEDKLPSVIGEIVERHVVAERARLDAEAKRVELERCRIAAVARAKDLFRQAHRAEVLEKQVQRWRLTAELRDYVEGMRAAIVDILDATERDAALEWVEWASAYADEIDPLKRPLRIPDDLDPTPEALAPFMRG